MKKEKQRLEIKTGKALIEFWVKSVGREKADEHAADMIDGLYQQVHEAREGKMKTVAFGFMVGVFFTVLAVISGFVFYFFLLR